MPSGEIAKPSIPLFVVRPVVLPEISVATLGVKLLIAKLVGNANDLTRSPVVRSN